MATEQWEIDLRKQLGKNKKKEIVIKQVPAKKTSNVISESLMMMFLLAILGISLLFAYDYKTNGQLQNLFFSSIKNDVIEKNEIPIKLEKVPQKQDDQIEAILNLKEDMQKNKVALDSLSAKIKANEEKICLMGIMFNENFFVLRNNLSKDNLIFFNRDWTINKMPKNIQLTEEDRAYLNKFVK